ncbi:MAG: hypothetical protein KME43_04615 [Myxacorys chilensis ATA2-1-KO14]|jgi:hypothetical protein|nr:hypothetical protein [Myxacorys chilensis ATA2-1-KO14]
MNIQLSSACGILVTLSCLIAQTGFAQSSLQIGNGKMIIQSRAGALELNHGSQALPSHNLLRQTLKDRTAGWTMEPYSTSRSSSVQRSSITLSAVALKQPCQLTILAPGATLTGQVKVDGKTIRVLKGSTSFNLSPYLSKGVKTVEISGHSSSTNTPIQVKLSAVGTQVTQQTSGNGKLNYLLVITVR